MAASEGTLCQDFAGTLCQDFAGTLCQDFAGTLCQGTLAARTNQRCRLQAAAMATARDRLAFALDFPTLTAARPVAERVAPHVGVLKVGLELFIQEGAAAVEFARSLGCDVFLDLKLHDIAKTVERAVGVASDLGVRYLTLHASGGPGMLESAARSAHESGSDLQLLGVTVLTSLDDTDLHAVGVRDDSSTQVERLARLVMAAGIDGLVCSALEVSRLRKLLGTQPVLVTPGIRPKGADHGDQKRVATPTDALASGASLLVVGRPIRDSLDPGQMAQTLLEEIEAVQ